MADDENDQFMFMGLKCKSLSYLVLLVTLNLVSCGDCWALLEVCAALCHYIVVSPQLFANESMSDHVGFARIFIEIINENDNRPIFSKPLYNISIPENTPSGTSLLRILVSNIENHCAVFPL